LAAVGVLGLSGLAGGTLAAAATNPEDWWKAWVNSADGERTFDRAARQKAEDILGDPRLLNLAHDLAWALPDTYNINDLALEMAGNRDVSVQSQVARLEGLAEKFAAKGTAEFQQVMTGMVQLIQAPQFQEAVQTLQRGKISIGRDVADTLALAPGTRWHSLVSGSIDGVLMFAMDPMLVAGRAAQYSQFLRRGIRVQGGEQAVDRFYHIYDTNQGVQKMHKAIASAVEAGDYRQMRLLAPTMKERWRDLLSYRDELVRTGQLKGRQFGVEDFHNWMVNMMHMQPLMEGFGTVRGLNNGVVLASIGRHNEAWRAAAGRIRSFTDGLTDIKFEKNLLAMLEEGGDDALRSMIPEVIFNDSARHAAAGELNKLAISVRDEVESFNRLSPERLAAYEEAAAAQGEAVIDVFAPGHTQRATQLQKAVQPSSLAGYTANDITPELLQEFALRNEQYAWSRMIGREVGRYVPGAASLGELFTKMTTMVPAGKAIHLVGYEAPEDIRALTELAGLTGMPQWLRREWADMMLWQPTVGMRMSSMQAFVDAMLTSSGIRTLPEGELLADKYLHRIFQSYAAGGLDTLTIGGRVSKQAIYLDEMADAIPMPNLTELRQAVKGGLVAKAIGIADLPVLEQFQTKVWKPSVLLRLGFIPRAAGEEFLNYMLRGGFGSLGQEMAGRSIARQQKYMDLVTYGKRGKVIESLADRRLLEEGPMPAGTRAVSRMLARYDWADPVTNVLERYATLYRSLLEEGMGLGDQASAMLTKIAGSDMPLYELADNVQDLNRTRDQLSAPLRARLNLGRTVDSLMFGNPLSWRRMMAGGVNDDVVEAAYEFFGHNGTSVMRAVGASNAGPYDPGSTRQDHIRIRIEDDVNGAPQYADYVTIRGQRTLRLNTDPYFANAAQEQAQRVMADELMRTTLRPQVANTKPEHLDAAPLPNMIEAYHGAMTTIGKEMIADFLGRPDWTRWEAMLQHVQRYDPDLAEHLSKTITRANFSFERVAASVFDAASGGPGKMNVGWDMISRDLTRWAEHDAMLSTLDEADRLWYGQYVLQSEKRTASQIREYLANPVTDMPAPGKVYYRGISSTEQGEIIPGPNGPMLRLYGQPQSHWNNGRALSFAQDSDHAVEYAGLNVARPAEYQMIVEVDGDAIEAMFGAPRTLSSDMMQPGTPWPFADAAQYLDPAIYQIGARGELNVKLQRYSDGVPDLSADAGLDVLADEFEEMFHHEIASIHVRRKEEAGIAAAEQRYENPGELVDEPGLPEASAFVQLDQVADQIRALRDIDPQLREETWADLRAQIEWNGYPWDVEDDVPEKLNRFFNRGGHQGAEYIDLQPGQWRIRSQYSEEPGLLKKQKVALDEAINNLSADMRWRRMNAGTDAEASTIDDFWDAEMRRLESERDAIVARMEAGESAGRAVEPGQFSRTGEFFREFGASLRAMNEEELMALLVGGQVRTANASVAATFSDELGIPLPGLDGLFDVSREFLNSPLSPTKIKNAQHWKRSAAYVEIIQGPTHHALDPTASVVKELATRWDVTLDEAAQRVVATAVERINAMPETDLLLLHDETKRLNPWQFSSLAEYTDAERAIVARRQLIESINGEALFVSTKSRAWNGSITAAEMNAWKSPWDTVEQAAEMAQQGLTWGSMPARSPFFSSWDDMAKAAKRDITNALHDPHYASRFGHMQGAEYARTGGQADNVEFGAQFPQHENMVTVWVPDTGYHHPDQIPTFGDLLGVTGDRSRLIRQRDEVEAYLQTLNETAGEGPAAFADRALADEIYKSLANWQAKLGYAPAVGAPAAVALDVPRVLVADSKGINGMRMIAGTPDRPRVWALDPDAYLSGGLGYTRTPDATMDAWAEELADRMIGRARQVWTRGNKEHLVPRTRMLDDGTEQTVVQTEGLDGLQHVPVGDKMLQRETVYDHNGERIEFGDERYFERVAEDGDGDIMWQLVAPILMDAADEVAGRSLFAAKRTIPEIGERMPAEQELVRAYRSKVQDAVAVGADLPNMVDSPVLATYKRSRWDEFVRKGFDEVIGPSIDALARRPMAFHFFSQRYIQNKAMRQWLRDPALTNRLSQIADRLAGTTALDARDVKQVAEYARTLGRYTDNAETAAKWSDTHALSWLRGHAGDDLPKLIGDAAYRVESELRQGALAVDEARDLQFALKFAFALDTQGRESLT
jgi:hypothetical protein